MASAVSGSTLSQHDVFLFVASRVVRGHAKTTGDRCWSGGNSWNVHEDIVIWMLLAGRSSA